MTQTTPLIEIKDLRVAFKSPQGELEAVRGVNLVVEEGQVAGIVGESGSGKSVAMLAAMGLLPPNATVSGSVKFHGKELLGRSSRELARIRGARIGMIFQDLSCRIIQWNLLAFTTLRISYRNKTTLKIRMYNTRRLWRRIANMYSPRPCLFRPGRKKSL